MRAPPSLVNMRACSMKVLLLRNPRVRSVEAEERGE